VLALPSKPWKKVRIEALADQSYRLVFLTEIDSEAEFLEIVEEDIQDVLNPLDRVTSVDWPSRSLVVTTPDLTALKRNLVFSCIMVELG